MSTIPLTRVRFILPFVAVLNSAGAATETLLEAHKLPANLDANLDSYIPLRNAIRFAERAGRAQGIPDLGFVAARSLDFDSLSARLRMLVRGAPTLFAALNIVCANAHVENTNLRMFLTFHGSSVRLNSQLIGFRGMQHLEHALWLQNVLSIHLVREFLGPDWAPATIAFGADYRPGKEAQEYWPGTRLLYGQEYSWIDFSSVSLSLPPMPRARDGVESGADAVPGGMGLVGELKLMLPSYMYAGGKEPSLMDIADMANTSPRTLQRMLAESGMSYRGIINAVRFERAVALLVDNPGVKIVDIARSLGYSDAAHFSRSFKAIAGVSPLQFRKFRLDFSNAAAPGSPGRET